MPWCSQYLAAITTRVLLVRYMTEKEDMSLSVCRYCPIASSRQFLEFEATLVCGRSVCISYSRQWSI